MKRGNFKATMLSQKKKKKKKKTKKMYKKRVRERFGKGGRVDGRTSSKSTGSKEQFRDLKKKSEDSDGLRAFHEKKKNGRGKGSACREEVCGTTRWLRCSLNAASKKQNTCKSLSAEEGSRRRVALERRGGTQQGGGIREFSYEETVVNEVGQNASL